MRSLLLLLALTLFPPGVLAAPLCSEVYIRQRSPEFVHQLFRSGGWAQRLWELKELRQEEAFTELESYLVNVLKTAEIQSIQPIGVGFSHPRLVDFGKNILGVIKNNRAGEIAGQTIQAEVAAYRLDRYLGHLNRVPLTVMRLIDGELHSVQLFVKSVPRTLKVRDLDPELFVFDFLIDNPDRIGQNLLYIEDMQTVAIDSGLGFRTEFLEKGEGAGMPVSKKLAWSYLLADCCMRTYHELEPALVSSFFEQGLGDKVPQSYRLIRNLNSAKISKLFGDILSEKEIKAFKKRRRVFLEFVQESVTNRANSVTNSGTPEN